jgi:DNA-binding GntR family transcriptional regulator
MRIILECYLLEQLMPRIDDAFIDRLETMVGQLERTEAAGPRLQQRRSFYETLYERAERPRALAQVNTLRGSVGRYLLLQRAHEHHHGHEDLIGFLRARDLAGAQRWLTAHLRDVSNELQSMVVRETEAAAEGSGAATRS